MLIKEIQHIKRKHIDIQTRSSARIIYIINMLVLLFDCPAGAERNLFERVSARPSAPKELRSERRATEYLFRLV